MVWCKCGPLAPQDDQSASLIGPGETEGKPRSATSRAAQRERLAKDKKVDGSDDTGTSTSKSKRSLDTISSPDFGF